MATVFVQDAGDIVEWVATADVTSNDFIAVGTKLGIALGSCLSGEKVSVKLTGVARLTKGVAEDYTAGTSVHADITAQTIVKTTAGDIDDVGIVTETSLSAVGTVLVRLNA